MGSNPFKQPPGWIGVDFDGTLADYSAGWQGPSHVGAPIPTMVARVKAWLAEGREVRIFTARIWPTNTVPDGQDAKYHLKTFSQFMTPRERQAYECATAIQAWCKEHIGRVLTITNVKDLGMIELYDDRCVQVVANTGELVGQSSRGL